MRRVGPLFVARLGGVLLGATLAGLLAQAPALADGPTTHRIVIEKFAFLPARIEIKAGDRVEWLNRDIAPHTASNVEGAWDTAELTRGMVAAVTFVETGTQAYFCAFHPNRRGEIVVLDE